MARVDDDLLLGPAGYVFQTPIKDKKNKPKGKGRRGGMRLSGAQIGRVARRRPEVMVKVTGSARGFRSLKEHFAYITRNGKIAAEREGGERIEGAGNVREMANEWWADCGRDRKASARDTINLILSMPTGRRMSLPERRRRGLCRGMFKPIWRHMRRTRDSPTLNHAAIRR